MERRWQRAGAGLRNGLAGLVLVGAGVGGLLLNARLAFGTASNMGPGYFPILISGLIALLGAGIMTADIVSPERVKPSGERPAGTPWRGILVITVGVAAFAFLVESLGLVLAAFGLLVLTSLATPNVRLVEILIFSALLTVFVVAVFSWGLEITVPVWPV